MKTLAAKTDDLMTKLSEPLGMSLSQHMDDQIMQTILLDWEEATTRLENKALRIETDPDDSAAMGEIKRTLHTIKGDSAACGLSEVSDVFHQVEDLLDGFIEEGVSPADMLLKVVDWLRKILNTIAAGAVQPESQDGIAIDSGKPPASRTEDKLTMKTLVVDDDFTNRLLLQEILKAYGTVHVAVNGKEAVFAIVAAQDDGEPYDLICLDIMMPEMDGQEALKSIRDGEKKAGVMPGKGVKIIMTTALGDSKNVMTSFKGLCDGYIVKPIDKAGLLKEIRKLSLIE